MDDLAHAQGEEGFLCHPCTSLPPVGPAIPDPPDPFCHTSTLSATARMHGYVRLEEGGGWHTIEEGRNDCRAHAGIHGRGRFVHAASVCEGVGNAINLERASAGVTTGAAPTRKGLPASRTRATQRGEGSCATVQGRHFPGRTWRCSRTISVTGVRSN